MCCSLEQNHFVVVYKIEKENDYTVYVSDPSYGLITYTREEFIKFWIGENADEKTEEGIALILKLPLHFIRPNGMIQKVKPALNFFQNTY